MKHNFTKYVKKGYFYFLSFTFLTSMLSSCREKYLLYDSGGNNDSGGNSYIAFDGKETGAKNYSFVFKSNDVKADTVWLKIRLIGNISDHDRTLALAQDEPPKQDPNAPKAPEPKPGEEVIEAVPGKHFVPFDDPEYKKLLILPAGKIEAMIPVVLLRGEDLKSIKHARLAFHIASGGDLLPGYADKLRSSILIADKLVKPNAWDILLKYVFGSYGVEKHRFMIQYTKFLWDDKYIHEKKYDGYNGDQSYLFALQVKLKNALKEENEKRAARGEKPLMEADGTEVTFGR